MIIDAAATGRNYRRGFRKGLRATEQLGFVLYDLCAMAGAACPLQLAFQNQPNYQLDGTLLCIQEKSAIRLARSGKTGWRVQPE